MATVSDLHLELVHKMNEEPVCKLWKAIEAQHQQHDVSLWHEARMQLFTMRKRPDESHVNYCQRTETVPQKIDRVKPPDLTAMRRSEEPGLLTIINDLESDNLLHRQLISQKDITLNNAHSSFLCTTWVRPLGQKPSSQHMQH